MFKKARIKLTAWYLLIIMAISFSFSVAIYAGINQELTRVYNIQRSRQQRVDTINNLIIQQGLLVPPENQILESETIEQARFRIIWALAMINLSILVLSGLGGYILAGRTLDPISKMVKEQKEFVGNASHELRTPLTSLKTEIEVALRDKNLSLLKTKNILKSNLEDVNSMQRLSNYLLNLGRYEKRSGIELTEINLKDVVTEAIKRTAAFAASKKIRINLDAKPIKVRGNKESLIELVTILIENAIKYSKAPNRVEIRVKKGAVLEVQDFGIGISADDMPHIFERFYRVEHSRSKEKIDGYGLGLSIAKSIVQLHKGKISVASRVGKGSTFRVQLS